MSVDHNAYLTFGSQLLRPRTYKIVVVNYTQGYNVQMNTATVRAQKHNYPIRVKESDFQFIIQCRSEEEFDTYKKEVRTSQVNALVNSAQGICRFRYPELKIDYLGYLTQSTEGIRRFEVAPTLPLTMLLIKDTVNTITTYSSRSVNWQDIYGTNVADLYKASQAVQEDFADGVAATHPPVGPRGNGNGRAALVK